MCGSEPTPVAAARRSSDMAHNTEHENPHKHTGSLVAENGSPFGLQPPDQPKYHHSVPTYRPTLHNALCDKEEQRSLTSQDSDGPTLEVNTPEQVGTRAPVCTLRDNPPSTPMLDISSPDHVGTRHPTTSDDAPATLTLEMYPPKQVGTRPSAHCPSDDAPATLMLENNDPEQAGPRPSALSLSDDAPATLTLEPADGTLLKSSTFPRSISEWRSFSVPVGVAVRAGGGALNRSDDISVCSVSSLSTELSASMSLGNDDLVDFVVTSDSSAVVTFENSDVALRFSDVQLPSPDDPPVDRWSLQRAPVGASMQEESKSKRSSPLMSFFNRSLFSKRMKDAAPGLEAHSDAGWRLFGRAAHRNSLKENESGARAGDSPRQSVRKNLEFEPLSTTALILEHRPANLPAKPAEEAHKHRQQYEEMVAQARKRELKEAQKRRKQFDDRVKEEESIVTAALTWSQEILPNWHSMYSSKRVRDMWWQGVPPSVRGRVWSLAVGNELNITPELYNICLARARERWKSSPNTTTDTEKGDESSSLGDREASLELIKLDISRTFPNLCIFQQGGPYHDVLQGILGAYTCYRPDVGYVQGMSFIAAMLILNMDTADAFIAFANLLNKPCQMAFYRVDHGLMLTYFAAFEVFFEENLPKLFAHFKSNNLTPDIYLIDWIFTLYSRSLALDVASRAWDVFCRDGEEFLFRTALGLLRMFQDVLTHMDFIHIAQFLTRLPEHVSPHTLFSCIASVNMTCRSGKWTQVLQALQKDPERASPVLKR